MISRRNLATACGLLAVVPAFARAQLADDKALAAALRAGGHVILVRHGATFADQADTDPFNLENIAAQRNLNENGKALAKAFGAAHPRCGRPDRQSLYEQVQPGLRNRNACGVHGHREDHRPDRRRAGGIAQ
jgi:hypothetical protein